MTFAGYAGTTRGDEVVADGAVLPAYSRVAEVLDGLGPAELRTRAGRRDALQRDAGMTFRLTGQSDRLLPMNLVPRIVAAAEWRSLARGLEQRARALTALLLDLAGPRECVRAGVLPDALAVGGPLLAPGSSVPPATVAGMDLLRDARGWRVLEDNLRVPSGLGYAMLVREIACDVMPELSPGDVANPGDAVPLLLAALRAAAPPACEGEPTLAVLSAGPGDSAHAEHALLAERLGVPVVTPAELRADDDHVSGPDGRVDVLYRRLDHEELASFTLSDGRPVLATFETAVHAGTLGLANALGTGVADDKAVYAYVPALIRFYLGEAPLLEGIPTWVLGEPEARAESLPRLHELVLKPVDGYGGKGVTFGALCSAEELATLRAEIERAPGRWVAQEPVEATTHPTLSADGELAACAVDLRAFVVSGTEAVTLPAALTRVAPPGSRIVNSSRGGGTKDTWILTV